MGYTPPHLYVTRSAGYSSVFLNSTGTGYGYIFANTGASTIPYILIDDSGATMGIGAGDYFRLADSGAGVVLVINYTTPDLKIAPLLDKNLYLKPSGTGKIKVAGTATGTGDVAINGHFDILDENGATIKLATVA